MFPSMPRSISPSLVDATADLDVDRGGPARPPGGRPRRRPTAPEGHEFAELARPDPGAERDRLQHLQAGDDHPPTARPDGRNGAHHACRLREAARRERPGGVRQAHQQPADQGHRVLPRPEGLRVPARPGPAGPHRGCAPATVAQLRVWSAGLLDGRGGLLAGDHARGGPRATTGRSTCASSRPTSTAPRSPSPAAGSTRRRRSRTCRAAPARLATSRSPTAATRSSKSLRSQMIFGEHDLGARAPFPRIDLHPVPQRPHLLHAADAARRPRDVRLLAARRRAPRPRTVRDGRGLAGTVSSRSTPGCGSTDALPGTAAAVADSRGRRRPGRRATMRRRSRRAIRSTRRDVRVAAESTEAAEGIAARPRSRGGRGRPALLHHPDQHGRPTDARDPRPRRSTRTSSISPSRCPRPPIRDRDRRCAHGKATTAPSTRSRRTTSRPTARASSRRSSGRTSGRPASVEGARHRADRRDARSSAIDGPAARAERRLERAAVVNRAPARAPTTS